MTSQIERIVQALREQVLSGRYEPGRKLAETVVAEALGTSRTPARLAMAQLEQEGLLVRTPRRGFRVRAFTLGEVTDAIEVRGELEAAAARILAERGLRPEDEARLSARIAEGDALLALPRLEIEHRIAFCAMNDGFHAALAEATENAALLAALAQVNRIPLASPMALVFNQTVVDFGHAQLAAAHRDHVAVLDAIRARGGTRAAAIMREHAHRSQQNKRQNFADMKANRTLIGSPGIALIDAAQ